MYPIKIKQKLQELDNKSGAIHPGRRLGTNYIKWQQLATIVSSNIYSGDICVNGDTCFKEGLLVTPCISHRISFPCFLYYF